VNIEKGSAQLVQDKVDAVVVGKRSEAQTCYPQSSNGVKQGAGSHDVHVTYANDSVPKKVASSKALNSAGHGSVSPQSFSPVVSGLGTIRVGEDDLKGCGVDNEALDHANHVSMPVDTPSSIEATIGIRGD